ncbi:MAG: hypothetical protein Tsb0034_24260 [Ekhidna sp.]
MSAYAQQTQTFNTTQTITLIREVKTTLLEDSLIYEKCQLFNDPSFLERSSLTATTHFHMNDDGSVLIEEEVGKNGAENTVKIYFDDKQIRLHDKENKLGSMRPQREATRNAFEGYSWVKNGKGESINGWGTQMMTGTKKTYAGDEIITAWYTTDFKLPSEFGRRLFPNPEANGTPVKLVQTSEAQCYQTEMTVLMSKVSDVPKTFDYSDWSIEDETIRETQRYEPEEYTEEMADETEEVMEGYVEEETYENDEYTTIVVDGKEYNLSYTADWTPLPFINGAIAYEIGGDRHLFSGTIANDKLQFEFPDSLFVYVDDYAEEKPIWLASDVFESYRYYPEAVPIYSDSQIAIRITPVAETGQDFLQDFSNTRNTFTVGESQIMMGERYYMNEESRAIHSIRYVLRKNQNTYVIDGFEQLGSNHAPDFIRLIELFLKN